MIERIFHRLPSGGRAFPFFQQRDRQGGGNQRKEIQATEVKIFYFYTLDKKN
jgi:hypothetical protein